MNINRIYFKPIYDSDGLIFLEFKDYQNVKKILNLPSGTFDQIIKNDFQTKQAKETKENIKIAITYS